MENRRGKREKNRRKKTRERGGEGRGRQLITATKGIAPYIYQQVWKLINELWVIITP